MSGINSEQLLNHLYYNKLPQVYRDVDLPMDYPLKRYLSALIDGGYVKSSEDMANVLNLIDPEKCPAEFLPIFCYSFGLEYFEDIDDIYQRRFLLNIGEIVRRRGTYSCVRFLARVLTGLNTEMYYVKGEYQGQTGRHLIVTLLAETLEQLRNIGTSVFVVERYIQTQIPFYIFPHVNSKIATQRVETFVHRGNTITSSISYNLRP